MTELPDQTEHNPRIRPLALPLSPALKARMAKIFPAELPLPQLYLTVARNEALFCALVDQGWIGPTGLFDRRSLPKRLREAIILRVCVASRCDYEFNLHVQTISQRMGLSRAQLEDIRAKAPSSALWADSERAVFALIDELVIGLEVSDEVYDAARAHFDEATLLEITHLVSLYVGVAMMVALSRPRLDRYAGP